MTEEQRAYLEDTWAIIYDYDGFNTVESLKGLIDETADRISNVLTDQLNEEDD